MNLPNVDDEIYFYFFVLFEFVISYLLCIYICMFESLMFLCLGISIIYNNSPLTEPIAILRFS